MIEFVVSGSLLGLELAVWFKVFGVVVRLTPDYFQIKFLGEDHFIVGVYVMVGLG